VKLVTRTRPVCLRPPTRDATMDFSSICGHGREPV
jgi:hypothetical protein